MLRWLLDLTPSGEVWGADVTATHIRWCKQHLSPPFHFLTTTVHPHPRGEKISRLGVV